MATTPSIINLDHNATTRLCPEALAAMEAAWRDAPGNPGSRHIEGRRARASLENSREIIAAILGATPQQVVFTSGGTEASNLALLGLPSGGKKIVAVPAGEHAATEQSVAALESRGWSRRTIPIDSEGRIIIEALDDLPWDEIAIATVLLAHNETGTIQDVGPLARLCRAQRVPLHIDAVQAVAKIDVSFAELGASTLALAAHKFHGPRGIGALLVRDDVRLKPVLYGGFQESGRRPGTECVALAAGMAAALERWHADRAQLTQQVAELRDRLEAGLQAACGPIIVNGCRAQRLPNTLNMAFPGCDGEALLIGLDLAGVCVSLGSACASGSTEPAPILVAMGRPPEVQNSSVRFSLGRDNTAAEIDEAVRRTALLVGKLRASSPGDSPVEPAAAAAFVSSLSDPPASHAIR